MAESIRETLLADRYRYVKPLGRGGFAQTFLAEDTYQSGNPWCVIKQLKPRSDEPDTLATAKRLFRGEAQTLSRLGNHELIPSLLDRFEQDDDFYLVQEYIEGQTLDQELIDSGRLSEASVVAILQDILQVLAFVHQQNVIHRDIKPSNIIRRSKDGKLVLIDFGAVKEVSARVTNDLGEASLTIAIGSPGYMPNEQIAGNPRFSSDIYAVGAIGIRALTGIHPRHLSANLLTSEIIWRDEATQVSLELAAILDRMVRYDFRDRYPTAVEALSALESLPKQRTTSGLPSQRASETTPVPVDREIHPPPTDPPRRTQPASKPQPSQSRTRLGSTVIPPTLTQIEFLKPRSLLAIFAATGVGAALLMTKTFVFPQSGNRSANNQGILARILSDESAPPSPKSALTGKSTPAPASSAEKSPLPPDSPAATSSPSTPESSAAELLSQAHDLREVGEYENAIAAYERVLESKPDIAQAHWGRCYSLNKLQRVTEALAACERAIALKPNYPEALWSKGYALDRQQRHQDALRSFEQAIALKPDYAEAWSNRGAVLLELNRSAESVEAFDKATAIDPDYAEAWANRGAALWSLGRYDEAIASIDKALKIQPDYQNALNLRQQAREEMGR